MMNRPTVSVIMPVYNGESHIKDAIDSVLNQTFPDLELIVLDDGSTDHTVERAMACDDRRIKVVQSKAHSGLPALLNRGMTLAEGMYLARMDADDICERDRLEKQVHFLDQHPEVGVCGTYAYTLGTNQVRTCPTDHEDIRASLLFFNDIVHPTVVMRSDDWVTHRFAYPSGYLYAEDYALWIQMIERVRFHILPDPLVHYRVHTEQVSSHHRIVQFASGTRLQGELLKRMGVLYTEEDLQLHTHCRANAGDPRLAQWFDKLLTCNAAAKVYPHAALCNIIDSILSGVSGMPE